MIYNRSLEDIYIEHLGITEAPVEWSRFCLYALVAAAAADRVWFQYRPTARTIPALYVMLVGASGMGKDESIGPARDLAEALPAVKTFTAQCSGQALIREMAAAQAPPLGGGQPRSLWFMTPELGLSLGEGGKAIGLIKILTGLYSMGGKQMTLETSTLMNGKAKVVNPCLNWLAGTTTHWLKQSISVDDIEAGFGSRIFMCFKELDFKGPRVLRAKAPANFWQLRDELIGRLQRITELSGAFRQTVGAAQVEEVWYAQRPAPVAEHLTAWWMREKENALKIAMVLSLCDRDDLVITDAHMARAQEICAYAGRQLDVLCTCAGLTRDQHGNKALGLYIRKRGIVGYNQLFKYSLAQLDMNRYKFTEALNSLVESGQVIPLNQKKQRCGGWRGNFYVWAAAYVSMPVETLQAVHEGEDPETDEPMGYVQ